MALFLRSLHIYCLLIFVFGFLHSESREMGCKFSQDCIRSSPVGKCPDVTQSVVPYETPGRGVELPKLEGDLLAESCPMYKDMEVCCRDDQIALMVANFKTIDQLFGECEICSMNLKKFWCGFTCDPYQQTFIETFGQIDYQDKGLILNMSMTIGGELACTLFNSCKKNSFIATLASGTSAPAFMQFQGSNAVDTGKVLINFLYSEDKNVSMITDMYPCNADISNGTIDGYHVSECGCNHCEEACRPPTGRNMPLFLDGFDWLVVILVYAAVVILSVIIFFVKRKYNRWQAETGSSDDGQDLDAVERLNPDQRSDYAPRKSQSFYQQQREALVGTDEERKYFRHHGGSLNKESGML